VRAAEINDSIPLLDLRRFDAGEAQRAAAHDVETRLLRDLMESARRFFSLPEGCPICAETV
jgi:hypothetical protein